MSTRKSGGMAPVLFIRAAKPVLRGLLDWAGENGRVWVTLPAWGPRGSTKRRWRSGRKSSSILERQAQFPASGQPALRHIGPPISVEGRGCAASR